MKYENYIDYFEPFARLGFAARGLVFLVIGTFAALAAIGSGQTMNSQEAVRTLLTSSYGTILAIILVVGLTAFAIWRLMMAIFDTDRKGSDMKGLGTRIAYAAGGLVYLSLAFYAYTIWSGAQSSGSGGSGGGQSTAGMISSYIGSTGAAIVLALLFAGIALAQFIQAFGERFKEKFRADAPMGIVSPLAKVGLSARGLVFLAIAALFAFRVFGGGAGSSSGSVGTTDALAFIWSLPFGTWLLAGIGLGFVCFALHCFALALYRRINMQEVKKGPS